MRHVVEQHQPRSDRTFEVDDVEAGWRLIESVAVASGVEAEGILLLLDQLGICASSGSACTTGSLDPSHVLLAMGCSAARARSSVRFSLGIYNTAAEVDYLLEKLPGVISRLRAAGPLESKAAARRETHPAPASRS